MENFDEIYESFTTGVINKHKTGEISKDEIMNKLSNSYKLEQIIEGMLKIQTDNDNQRYLEDWELIFEFLKEQGFPYTFRCIGRELREIRDYVPMNYFSKKIKDKIIDYCNDNGIDRNSLTTRGKAGCMFLCGYQEPSFYSYQKDGYDNVNDRFIYFLQLDNNMSDIIKDFSIKFLKFLKEKALNEKGYEIVVKKIETLYDDLLKINGESMNESFTKNVIKKFKGFGKNKIENVPEIDPLYGLIRDGMENIKKEKEDEFNSRLKSTRIIYWYFNDMRRFRLLTHSDKEELSWTVVLVSCRNTGPAYLSNDPKNAKIRQESGYQNQFFQKNYTQLKKFYNKIRKNKQTTDVYYTEMSPYLNKISNKEAFKKGFLYFICDETTDFSEEYSYKIVYKICKYILKNLTNPEEKNSFYEYIKYRANNK